MHNPHAAYQKYKWVYSNDLVNAIVRSGAGNMNIQFINDPCSTLRGCIKSTDSTINSILEAVEVNAQLIALRVLGHHEY